VRAHVYQHRTKCSFTYTRTGLSADTGGLFGLHLSCRRSLSKGLPRTFKVRERQLEAGRKLVTTLTTFLILLAIFAFILVALVQHDDKDQESNDITKWCATIEVLLESTK
jgi:hypothetical protein